MFFGRWASKANARRALCQAAATAEARLLRRRRRAESIDVSGGSSGCPAAPPEYSVLPERDDGIDASRAERRNEHRACTRRNDQEQAPGIGNRIEEAHGRADCQSASPPSTSVSQNGIPERYTSARATRKRTDRAACRLRHRWVLLQLSYYGSIVLSCLEGTPPSSSP